MISTKILFHPSGRAAVMITRQYGKRAKGAILPLPTANTEVEK